MGKYLDPRFDITFKAVFAEHADLIISFLNAILPLGEDELVTEVEYLPSELLPVQFDKKNSIVDVRCKDKVGRQFIVEMQMYWTDEFKQRVLFNASKAYVKQLDGGKSYRSLEPVFSLNLVNDIAFKSDKYYHQFQVAEKGDPDQIIEGMELVFVELPKFHSEDKGVNAMMRLWLRFLTEINTKTEKAPQELLDNPLINKALSIVERSAYTDAQLETYDKIFDIIATEITLKEGAFNDGEKKGRAEGEAIGEARGVEKGKAVGAHNEKIENARKMKSKGYPIEDIAEITGLSIGEINNL